MTISNNFGGSTPGGQSLGNASGSITIDTSSIRASMQAASQAIQQMVSQASAAAVQLDGTFKQAQTSANAVGKELNALKTSFTAATPAATISAYAQARAEYDNTRAALRNLSQQLNAGTIDAQKVKDAWDALTVAGQKLNAVLPTIRTAPAPGQPGFIGPVLPTTPAEVTGAAPFAPLPRSAPTAAVPTEQQAALASLTGIWKTYAAAVMDGFHANDQAAIAQANATQATQKQAQVIQPLTGSLAALKAQLQTAFQSAEAGKSVTNLTQLAQAVAQVNSQFNASKAVGSAAESALRELDKEGVVSNTTMRQLAQAVNQAESAAQKSGGAWQNLARQIQQAERRDTILAFRELFRTIENGYPLIGLMINPLATVIRQLDQLVKTGGPAGAVLKSLTTSIGNFAKGVVTIASGIILRDIIEAPFRLAATAIGNAERAITSFISKGIQLNGELGKTQEQIAKQNALWDDLAIVLTKPAYDFVIGKIQEIGRSLASNFGSGASWQTGLMSLGSALGTELQRVLSYLTNWVSGIFSGGGPFDPTVWAENAAQLAGEFANGLITGFTSVVIPAFTSIVEAIAGMIIGQSPPPLGPLRNIILGGKNLIDSWLQGMLQADFSILDTLTGLVKSKLDAAVAAGSLSKDAESGLLASAQDTLAGILASITETGSATAAQMATLHSLFGDLTADVEAYIGAVEAWRNAQAAVAAAQAAYSAAQEHVKDVQDQINAAVERQQAIIDALRSQEEAALAAEQAIIDSIQEKIRVFNEDTAEIPERFTRGAKRQLEDELAAAEAKRKATQANYEAQIRAQEAILKGIEQQGKAQIALAQAQAEAARKNLEAAQAQERSAQNQMRLMEELLKAEQKAQEAAAKEKVLTLQWKPDPKLAADIQKWIDEHIVAPFQKGLGSAFGDLQFLFKGLAGVKIPKDQIDDLTDSQRKAYEEGLKLKTAFDDMGTAMKSIPGDLHAIAAALQPLGDLIRGLTQWWQQADQGQREWAVGAAAVVAFLPQIITFALNVVGAVGLLARALVGAGALFGGLAESVNAGVLALGTGAASLGLIVTGLVAVVALGIFNLKQDLDEWNDWVSKNGNPFQPLIDGFNNFIGYLAALPARVAAATGALATPLTILGQIFQDLWDKLFGHSIIPDLEAGFDSFVSFLGGLAGRIAGVLGGVGGSLAGLLGLGAGSNPLGALADLPAKAQDIADQVKTIFTNLHNDAFSLFDDMVKGIGTYLSNLDTDAANKIQSLYTNAITWFTTLRDTAISLFNEMALGIIEQLDLIPTREAEDLTTFLETLYTYLATAETAWADYFNWLINYAQVSMQYVNQILGSQAAQAQALGSGSGGVGGNNIPQLALGGYIMKSGYAYVHAGETVAPSRQMERGNLNVTLQFQFPPGIEKSDQTRLRQMMKDVANDEIASVLTRYWYKGS